MGSLSVTAEANRKRSEAAKGNKNSNGSNQYAAKPKEDSDGTDCAATVQTEDPRAGEKMGSGDGTDCAATKQNSDSKGDSSASAKGTPKPDSRRARNAKAAAIGANRGDVQRWEQIVRLVRVGSVCASARA